MKSRMNTHDEAGEKRDFDADDRPPPIAFREFGPRSFNKLNKY